MYKVLGKRCKQYSESITKCSHFRFSMSDTPLVSAETGQRGDTAAEEEVTDTDRQPRGERSVYCIICQEEDIHCVEGIKLGCTHTFCLPCILKYVKT